MGENELEARALTVSISEIATGRRACVCLSVLEKDPDTEKSYKKKSGKPIYSKRVCLP